MMPFFCIHISQSSVATCLQHGRIFKAWWSGGIFKHEFVANLLPSRLVKKIENRIIISEVLAKSLVSCFFLTHCVYSPSTRVPLLLLLWVWYVVPDVITAGAPLVC